MAMKLRIIVPPHPLIAHWLTMLRNAKTPPPLYSTALEELGKWLTYEAIRDWLPYRTEEVETERAKTEGKVIEASVPLLSIPFKAGGFELWHGARTVLPNSSLCLKGIPSYIEEKAGLLIFTGQISNGDVIVEILKEIQAKKIETRRVRIICALACSVGLAEIGKVAPDLNIYCACIDPDLSKDGFVIPGIGNPSLRLNTRI